MTTCQFCGEETPCGHEREIARLKGALRDIIKIIAPSIESTEKGRWLLKWAEKRRSYDPEEDSFE